MAAFMIRLPSWAKSEITEPDTLHDHSIIRHAAGVHSIMDHEIVSDLLASGSVPTATVPEVYVICEGRRVERLQSSAWMSPSAA